MFEKHEKWFVLGFIALAIWYFYKKGKSTTSSTADGAPMTAGSIVNPTQESLFAYPAQTTTPVIFNPAQPSAAPVQSKVSIGQFTYSPMPGPARQINPNDANLRNVRYVQ